ncbi:MAG: AsmA family protein, partial [Alphaproteobacteria bacterium]
MRFVIGFFTVVALLIVGFLVAPSFIDVSKYKDQGLAQVKAFTGYEVTIDGDFSFGILPSPHVKAEQVAIVNPAVSAEAFASFDALSVSVNLMPLLSKRVEVSEVTLVKPDIRLATDKDGKGNWISPEIEVMSAGKADKPKAGGAAPEVSFDRITIKDGAFAFDKTEISNINLKVKAKSLQGPFDASGALVFGGQDVVFDAKSGVLDAAGKRIALNANAKYGDIDAKFEGSVDYGALAVEGGVEASAFGADIAGDLLADAKKVR